jgi:murein DD-endopeptidase MepM/ murein hydrolase activator NlpD
MCLIGYTLAISQNVPQGLFSAPMSIPLTITAGFGEIRPNHFHSGIDFSTQGRNQAVLAVEEGYISRIKISASGYGNALYINHPNGLTTVYGHLSTFNDTINQYVNLIQQQGREYEVDVLPDPLDFPVKRQQFIGWSGNSGSSSAPHLHFEIRDQGFENVLNPLLFGYGEKDNIAPDISAVSIFPMEGYGRVNELKVPANFPLVVNKKTKKKGLSQKVKMPIVSGWVGFGFQGGDVIGKITSKTGIFKIQLLIDSNEVFQARFDEFSFDETRSVNAYQDYPERIRTKRKIQRCVVPVNPMIGIYKKSRNSGYYYFNEDRIYSIVYMLTDLNGNTSTFNLKVRGKAPDWGSAGMRGSAVSSLVLPGVSQQLALPDFQAEFQPESLFDSTWVKLVRANIPNSYSPLIELGSKYVPVNQAIRLRFLPAVSPDSIQSKLIITQKKGSSFSGLKSNWSGQWLEAETFEFGDFQVHADTVAPVVKVIPQILRKKRKKIPLKSTATGRINIQISDRLSGVASMQAALNGNWILLEPSSSTGLWTYRFPDELPAGIHELRIEAIDGVGNSSLLNLQLEKP